MKGRALVGYFGDERALLEGARASRQAGLLIHDAYTPYAVHGLDEAMGLRPSRLPYVCLGAALAGLVFGLWMQYHAAVVSWPLNVGGKPFWSWPAFLPVAFEMTVLTAGLVTVSALFLRARLFPLPRPGGLARVTDDRFALALEASGAGFDPERARDVLRRSGALETRFEEVPS